MTGRSEGVLLKRSRSLGGKKLKIYAQKTIVWEKRLTHAWEKTQQKKNSRAIPKSIAETKRGEREKVLLFIFLEPGV